MTFFHGSIRRCWSRYADVVYHIYVMMDLMGRGLSESGFYIIFFFVTSNLKLHVTLTFISHFTLVLDLMAGLFITFTITFGQWHLERSKIQIGYRMAEYNIHFRNHSC